MIENARNTSWHGSLMLVGHGRLSVLSQRDNNVCMQLRLVRTEKQRLGHGKICRASSQHLTQQLPGCQLIQISNEYSRPMERSSWVISGIPPMVSVTISPGYYLSVSLVEALLWAERGTESRGSGMLSEQFPLLSFTLIIRLIGLCICHR